MPRILAYPHQYVNKKKTDEAPKGSPIHPRTSEGTQFLHGLKARGFLAILPCETEYA
jgi:hypothetical protein